MNVEAFCKNSRRRAASLALATLLLVVAAPIPARASTEPRPEVVKIEGPIAGLKLALLHQASPRADAPMVLVLHGQAVAQEGNMAFPIGGRSMLRALAETGLDMWALDYYGFGASDRYPEMNEPANAHPPLGQVQEVADQVASAISYLRSRNGRRPIMLLGDSRGSVVAGVYAARQPGTLSRLILFAPVTSFTHDSPPANPPAYFTFTPKELWPVLSSWADANPGQDTLDPKIYDAWAKALLDSDPTSRTRNPPSIKVPNGGVLDDLPLMSGGFPYDPSKINVPTLIIMGETDAIATFPGAQWLLGQLRNAPHRRLVVVGNGSHTIQFEKERGEVYKAVAEFFHEEND